MSSWTDKNILAKVEAEENSTPSFKFKAGSGEQVPAFNPDRVKVPQEQFEKASQSPESLEKFMKGFEALRATIDGTLEKIAKSEEAKGDGKPEKYRRPGRKVMTEMAREMAKIEGMTPANLVAEIATQFIDLYAEIVSLIQTARIDEAKAAKSRQAASAAQEIINETAHAAVCVTAKSMHNELHKKVEMLSLALKVKVDGEEKPEGAVEITIH